MNGFTAGFESFRLFVQIESLSKCACARVALYQGAGEVTRPKHLLAQKSHLHLTTSGLEHDGGGKTPAWVLDGFDSCSGLAGSGEAAAT